ncbi:SDR family NAD(P)-dependent oxidoreductase [Xanthomonas hyacinthi]|uniref:Short-chain dehydrogenase/reductase n=2 Tax=Xanthomonas hyacinthi TaxID=56455 RepID=A0A2S7EYA6_9XANT|nr:SDR family NAD(P)-dependent oxidoreductase [Xanthomonas hyacinthi]PPU98132.1 short-chain dehydrogenase/reductase [Xanthomonas hyacinthi]QGY76827.1 SDR family NAD(P)-dependent oxidoreductase [Xanthomonas hyacinthi]
MGKTWLITGTTRGMGVAIAKAALEAGDRVVATGRRVEAIQQALGTQTGSLLAVELEVGDASQAAEAAQAAVARFGGIDVLVNNAGYGHMGFFEELELADAQAQLATNLFGAFNVTWAVLPLMRAARRGHIFNVSSLGGLVGGELASLYCASKFGLEGFSECLAREVQPFGIGVTIVEPGPFRTEFLSSESLRFGGHPIADYDQRRQQLRQGFEGRSGQQPGDPARLAAALVQLAGQPDPPLRFLAGAMAVEAATTKLNGMLAEIARWRELSIGTDAALG